MICSIWLCTTFQCRYLVKQTCFVYNICHCSTFYYHQYNMYCSVFHDCVVKLLDQVLSSTLCCVHSRGWPRGPALGRAISRNAPMGFNRVPIRISQLVNSHVGKRLDFVSLIGLGKICDGGLLSLH